MDLSINSQLVITCVFYFIFSSVLAYLFRRFHFFFKVLLIPVFFAVFGKAPNAYISEALVSSLSGIVFIFIEPILHFFTAIWLWIENIFAGISYRFRLIASVVGKILYAVRWVFRLVFIPIANAFTWFYNFLSRTFHWNRVFIPLTEQFRKKYRQAEPGRTQKESPQSRQSGTDYARSAQERKRQEDQREQEEQIRRAKEKVRQAREEAEKAQKAEREEEQRGGSTGDRRTPRQILGLGESFTLDELKKAYRSAASRYHPDKHLGMSETFKKEAEAEFIKVQNAYNTLLKHCR